MTDMTMRTAATTGAAADERTAGGWTAGAAAAGGGTAGERAAARAYLRLLAAVRAVLGETPDAPDAGPLLAGPLAEADAALGAAGLAGNEREFLRLVARQAQDDDPRRTAGAGGPPV